jgi:hypothetical protein
MKITDKSNKYVRPMTTQQDIITQNIELFNDKLKDYVQIHAENYGDIDTGIWIKYISHDGKYRSGGILIVNRSPLYFILKNPFNNLSWSVNLLNNIIFMKNNSLYRTKMIEKNNLYKLYEAGLVEILEN